jgi:tRNA dimethylallyltransferase
MSERIVIISGPTASGKSDIALKLAETKNIAIINADSLQIYEGLPILSSQPSLEEQKKVKHFLYSHFKPQESSSVALWLKLVKSAVEEVLAAKKTPVIVGGSGMYISKLVEGISEIPEVEDDLRKGAIALYEAIGHEEFQKKLIDLGEDKILDKHRMIRAYEVLSQTGKSISYWQSQPQKKIFEDADFIHVNLNLNREKLYENCNLRFERMLECGAFEEVQSLVNQGIEDDKQITKTLGFYEISDFLLARISREEMIKSATQKTRNYAKRQLTWFRNQLPQKLVFESSTAALKFLENEI